jgi:hypothetical protein
MGTESDKTTVDQTYSVSLKVKYQTIPGESVIVVGSIPELGSWKNFKLNMQWTEGHVWVLKEPILTSQPFFQYKYMLTDTEKVGEGKWERGIDRIIDMRDLPSVGPSKLQASTGETERLLGVEDENIKHVELVDEWEKFNVKFSIYYPLSDGEEMVLRSSRAEVKNSSFQ